MTNTLLKVALALIITIAIPLLFIHAQAFDDSELRAFLTPPEGCPAPCFMGIRPGETGVRTGGGYLQTNPAIESTRAVSFQFFDVRFAQDAAPMREARLYLLAAPDVTITRINLFDTGLPLSRFFLALGDPARLVVYKTIRLNVVTFVAFYPDYWLYVLVDLPLCSVDQELMWDKHRDVSMGIGLWREDDEQPDYYLSPTDLNIQSWAKQLRDMKRERCT
jgi:hypothetical protein